MQYTWYIKTSDDKFVVSELVMFTTMSLCLLFLLYLSTGNSKRTGTGDCTGTGSHNVEM